MPSHLALVRAKRHRGRPSGQTSRRLLAAVVSVVCAAGIGIGTAAAFAADTSTDTLVAAPAGSGTACSEPSPCSVSTAVATALPGTSIVLQTGYYGDQVLRGRGGSGAGGRRARDRLRTTLYIRPSAVGTVIDAVHLDGAGMFVRSTDVTVQNSVFENGHSIDGIQIGRASRVKIVGNTISHYDQSGTSGLHADCVQIFDSSDIEVRDNRISNCYNSGLIFSGGSQLGVTRVTVESNFIQGCVIKTAACKGGSAIDLREKTTSDVTVRNNTILDGSTRVATLPGVVFDRNIVSYLAVCDGPITNSIITAWNSAVCGRPSVVDSSGNREGTVSFVDRANGDLHLADVESAAIQPESGAPVAADIDGLPMPANIAGAASGGSPATPTPDPTSPSTDPPTPAVSDVPTQTPSPSATPFGRPTASPEASQPAESDHGEPTGTSAVRPLRLLVDAPGISPRTLEILARIDAARVWIERDGHEVVAQPTSTGRWALSVPEAWMSAVREGDYDLIVQAANGDVTMLTGYAPVAG